MRSVTAREKLGEVGLEVGEAQRHRYERRPGERDERRVRVVVRLEDDDLVGRAVDQGEERRRERLCRSRGDDHLAVGIDVEAVEPLLVGGDGLQKLGHASSGRVLVRPRPDSLLRRSEHLGGAVFVGKALPEVHGARPGCERGHLGEDGRGGHVAGPEQARAPRGAAPGAGDLSHAPTLPAPLRRTHRFT